MHRKTFAESLCGLYLTLLLALSDAQPDFRDYYSTTQFTCNEPTVSRERIILNTQCGEILSPCFPNSDYPIGIESGFKIWDLEPGNVQVTEIRFIVNDFSLSNAFLDFSTTVRYNQTLNLNVIVPQNQTGRFNERNTATGNIIPVTASRLYMTFVSLNTTSRGFNISYCASVNSCASNPCHSEATCVNTFRGFVCSCNPGFSGDGLTCADVNMCALNPCDSEATCVNTFGSFVCSCNPGFSGDGLSCAAIFCIANEIAISDVDVLTFNQTFPQLTAYSNEMCESGVPLSSINCLFSEANNRYEFSLNTLFLIDCNLVEITDIINTITLSNVTAESIEIALGALDLVTSVSNNESVPNAIEVVAFLDEISANIDIVEISEISYSKVVSIADHVSIIAQDALDDLSMIDMEGRLLQSLVTIGTATDLSENPNFLLNILTPNVATEVSDRPSNQSFQFNPELYANAEGEAGEMIQPVSIVIPPEALQTAVELEREMTGSSSDNVRIVSLVYRTSALFPTNASTSWVVSVDLNDKTISNFGPTVNIIHRSVNSSAAGVLPSTSDPFNNRTFVNQTCVFWDFDINSWSTDGCGLVRDSNPPECRCNHLTNFAILLSIREIPKNIALDTISFVGCIISIICLVSTILLLCLSRSIRIRRPITISINICTNLLLSFVVFLGGIDERDHIARCITSAVFLHFFLLCTFFWMIVYAHILYKSFIEVFSATRDDYLRRAYVFCYGIPAAIVAVNTAVTLSLSTREATLSPIYGEVAVEPTAVSAMLADNMCWLQGHSLYFAFILPVGMILLINAIVFFVVIRNLTWNRKKVTSNENSKQSIRHQLRIAITLATTLGLVWILGYFMLLCRDQTCLTVMSWVFAIAVTSQGLSIFTTCCILNKEIRKIWLPRLFQLPVICCEGDLRNNSNKESGDESKQKMPTCQLADSANTQTS